MHQPDDLTNEVQELVWALVDEQASDEQVRRLEELLLENQQARHIYVMCMQMHADLHYLLSGKQPRLPIPLQKVGKATEATKSRPPLPMVELPPAPASVPLFDERRREIWRLSAAGMAAHSPALLAGARAQVLHHHRHHRDDDDRRTTSGSGFGRTPGLPSQ